MTAAEKILQLTEGYTQQRDFVRWMYSTMSFGKNVTSVDILENVTRMAHHRRKLRTGQDISKETLTDEAEDMLLKEALDKLYSDYTSEQP
jgi:hypothetical protein